MSDTARDEFGRLNAEIGSAEKRAMLLSLTGRFTAAESAGLDALYQRRRAWLDEQEMGRIARRNGGAEDENEDR